jgi:hypothetical protein
MYYIIRILDWLYHNLKKGNRVSRNVGNKYSALSSALRLCHGSGSWLPVCHCVGAHLHPGQSIWDLWWTEWHWDRFFLSSVVFPIRYHSTVALHTHISSGEWTIVMLVDEDQRHSLTPSTCAWSAFGTINFRCLGGVCCGHISCCSGSVLSERRKFSWYVWYLQGVDTERSGLSDASKMLPYSFPVGEEVH